jgi:thiol-disulfide isomerase/thioredoxin
VAIVVGLLAAATAFGLWWRARDGRVTVPRRQRRAAPESSPNPSAPTFGIRSSHSHTGEGPAPAPAPPGGLRDPAALGFDPGSAELTLVQFSTAFCQPCRATRVILAEVATLLPGVRHVEVDAESHLDLVRELDIRRTPTVLFVDSGGRIVRRVSGQPRKAAVIAAVAPFLTSRS